MSMIKQLPGAQMPEPANRKRGGASAALDVLRHAGLRSSLFHPAGEAERVAREPLHILLHFAVDCGFCGKIIVKEGTQPLLELWHTDGPMRRYSYHVSTLLKVEREGGALGRPLYLDAGQDISIDSGVLYNALRHAIAKIPRDHGYFEVCWCEQDPRVPF